MRSTALATALIVAATPFTAAANPFGGGAGSDINYDYIGSSYASTDRSGITRLDGFDVEGSLALTDTIHVMGDFLRGKDSPDFFRRTRAAVGFHSPVNPTTDFVARIGWSFSKLENRFGSDSANGVLAQVGVRGMASPELELNMFVSYDDTDAKASFDLGAIYNFTPDLGATAGYSYASNLEIWSVGLRYHF